MGESLAQQVVGIAGLRDDVEPRFRQQSHHALAEQHIVLSDHDAYGFRHPANVTPSGNVSHR